MTATIILLLVVLLQLLEAEAFVLSPRFVGPPSQLAKHANPSVSQLVAKTRGDPLPIQFFRSSSESFHTICAINENALSEQEKSQVSSFKTNNLKPKDLLAKYGAAYLATSITLSIFSYSFFYILVANGVDVAALLQKVGISSTAAATKTGTAAIAYALHKAASPIRFPPTVLLTPVVANLFGKKPADQQHRYRNAA